MADEKDTDLPVLPCQALGLCKYAQQLGNYISKKSNYNSKRYTIFIILLMEIASIPLAYNLGVDFNNFWYPFLANNSVLLLLYKNYCDRKILRYCQRTIYALRFMVVYFLINTLIMSTGFMVNIYYQVVTYLLLTAAFIILLLTMYKPNNK